MNNKYLFIVAAMAVTLVGTTPLATSESAFASDENQAVSQANACGNGELPLNVGCQNIDSQIQGDENEIAIAGVQSFPQINNEEPEPPK
jgi:hypothetical protein